MFKDDGGNIYCGKCKEVLSIEFSNSNKHQCNEPTTPTKVYKITIKIIDFDQLGIDGIKEVIENQKYPNWCISPTVIEVEERTVDWNDNHPLNKIATSIDTFKELFS